MIIRETMMAVTKLSWGRSLKDFQHNIAPKSIKSSRFCVFFYETPGLSMQFLFPFAMNILQRRTTISIR